MTTQELFEMLACDGFYFAHDGHADEVLARRQQHDADEADRAEYEDLVSLGCALRSH